MRTAIWLLLLQASLGAFDTLYYHEYRLKLAHGMHTRVELRLHASRDFAYAIIIGSLGFLTWHGAFAWVLLGCSSARSASPSGISSRKTRSAGCQRASGRCTPLWALCTERFWPS
jgi:hypothetical protein